MVDEILPPPPPDPPTESAWERGLRHAKEVNAFLWELLQNPLEKLLLEHEWLALSSF